MLVTRCIALASITVLAILLPVWAQQANKCTYASSGVSKGPDIYKLSGYNIVVMWPNEYVSTILVPEDVCKKSGRVDVRLSGIVVRACDDGAHPPLVDLYSKHAGYVTRIGDANGLANVLTDIYCQEFKKTSKIVDLCT